MPRTKTNRRAQGEGSLFKREKDGLWMGYVTTEAEDGKQKKLWVSSKKQTIAKQKLDALKDSIRKGTFVNRNDVTLNERISHWLEHEIKPGVAEGTHEKYRINFENHIENDIGKEQIQKINRSMMVEYLAKKEKELAPETVKILLSILRRVFDIALVEEIIAKSPLLMVKRTQKVVKRKTRPLTLDEEKKLLEAAQKWTENKKHNAQAYSILFAEYGTGLRRSEVLPLKKSDINFTTRELQINRVYVMVKGKPKLEDRAKSEASLEPIVIPEMTAAFLEGIETAEAPNDYLFPARNGGPINPNSFRRTFKRILNAAGLDEEIRLHDLRHNYASQMVALNVHMSLVQAQMRHADIKTTSRYTHTTTEGQKQAADLINTHLQKIVSG